MSSCSAFRLPSTLYNLPTTKLRNWPIHDLPGIAPEQSAQLTQLGLSTTFDLLRRCRSQRECITLAHQLGLHIKHINKWVALARLAAIPSVGCQYCGLLLHAGISSPGQLATISIAQLYQQLKKLQIKLIQRSDLCPDQGQISRWISEAQGLGSSPSPDTRTSP